MGEFAELCHDARRAVGRRMNRALLVVAILTTAVSGMTLMQSSANAATADYTLAIFPPSQTLPRSVTTSYWIELGSLGGFNTPVNLTATGLPAGVTGTFAGSQPIPTNPATGTLFTINASSTAALATATFTITGLGGGITHTATATATVDTALVPVCAAAVSGIVTDNSAAHLPIAGVKVSTSTAAIPGEAAATATTDATGAYSIATAAVGNYNAAIFGVVTATLDPPANNHIGKYWDINRTAPLVCGHPATLNIEMAKVTKATLGGTVFEGVAAVPDYTTVIAKPGGLPIANAGISINAIASAASDATGTWAFKDNATLNPGFHLGTNGTPLTTPTLLIGGPVSNPLRHRYWQPAPLTLPTINDGDALIRPLLLVPQCTASVSVTVTDSATGLPLTGVSVNVKPVDTRVSDVQVFTTTATGVINVAEALFGYNNQPGKLHVTTTKAGYNTIDVETADLGCGGASAPMVAAPPDPTLLYGSITGKVVDSVTNVGVAGVPVKPQGCVPKDAALDCLVATTDTNGNYTLNRIPVGTSPTATLSLTVTTVFASAITPDYWNGSTVVVVKPGPPATVAADVKVVKRKFAQVTGIVTDSVTLLPVPGVDMSGSSAKPHAGCAAGACVTDATGKYTLVNVDLSNNNTQFVGNVIAALPGYWTKTTPVTLNVDLSVTVNIALVKTCFASIGGSVQDASTKAPIEGAKVQVVGNTNSQLTAADGTFLQDNVALSADNAPRTYSVTASKAGYYTETQSNITVTCNNKTVLLFGQASDQQLGGVSGVVTNTSTHLPMSGVPVVGAWGESATTDATGHYALIRALVNTDGSDRTWIVTAQPGTFPSVDKQIVIKANQTATLNFEFPPSFGVIKDNDANRDGTFNDSEAIPANATYPRVVTYRAKITNSITTPLQLVTLVDDKTASLTLGASAAVSCASLVATSLAAGATVTCYYDVSLAAAGSTIVNTLTATSPTGGTGSDTSTVTFAAPAPTVTSLSPTTGSTAGGTSVTITGTNLTGLTAVSFGTTAATSFTPVSATSATAVAPAHAAGLVDVMVTTPGGTSAVSVGDQFTYATPPPAPTVTSLSPTSGSTAGGTVVTITGTSLTGVTGVSFGGNAATTFSFVSATSVTATAPSHAAGQVDVTVTTPGGTSALSAGDKYTFVAPAGAPTITAISPTSGTTAGATVVTITGTNLTGATAVSFGTGAGTALTPISATSMTATSPAHAAGIVDITVITPGGISAVSAADKFTFVAPPAPPTVTSLSPTSGSTAGATVVTITGTNFTGVTGVSFGGTAAAGFSFISATSMTATSPAHAAGGVDVKVTTPGGTSAVATGDFFTFVTTAAPPTVTSLSPTSGPIAGGTVITITGANLTGATVVSFGGIGGTALTPVSATSMKVTSPAHVAGAVDVTVITPAGTSAVTAGDTFTFVGAPPVLPTVTSISPTSGPIAGGTVVTITGTNLTGITAVTFGTAAATAVTPVSATSATAVAPAHAAGLVDVTVITPGGTSVVSAGDKYTFVAPPALPTVTSLSPTSGPIAGGTVVTITGTNLTGVTGVSFGGTAAAAFSFVSATSVQATSPAHAAGAVDVKVTTPAGTSATSAGDTFTFTAAPPVLPTVTSISPTSGPIAGGTVVTITGTNLTGATGVTFGGVAATAVTPLSATSVQATAPAHAAGAVDVKVTTGAGTSAVSAGDTFTFNGDTTPPGPTPEQVNAFILLLLLLAILFGFVPKG